VFPSSQISDLAWKVYQENYALFDEEEGQQHFHLRVPVVDEEDVNGVVVLVVAVDPGAVEVLFEGGETHVTHPDIPTVE